MITEDQLEKLYGDDAKELFKYLKNKNKGGTNNAKGASFENQFAVFEIARHFNRSVAPNTVHFSSQSLSFIDDLVIRNAGQQRVEHYQLKDVQTLSWADGNHPIGDDFILQHAVCADNGEKAELELVVSSSRLKKDLDASMAANLKDKVTVCHFAKGSSMSRLLQVNDEAKKALAQMCGLTQPTADKLDTLGNIVLGAWSGCEQKETTLEELLNACYEINPHYIRGFENRISKRLSELLENIPGFSFSIEGGFIKWSYESTDSGVLSYRIGSKEFLDWESAILKTHPIQFEEMENHLL